MNKRLWIAVLALLLGTQVAVADVVTLTPLKDNTLYEDPNGELSNGAGDHIFAGRTDDNLLRRALVQFDVASAVPSGSTIDSVYLTMFMSRSKTRDQIISLHRTLADWGEAGSEAAGEEGAGTFPDNGDATWKHTFYPGSEWSSLGGDYDVTVSASLLVGNQNNYYTWESAGLVTDVQGWLDTPSTNHGWTVIGNEVGQKVTMRFDSRQNDNPARRPMLRVVFTPTVVGGACCLPEDSCAVLTATECANQSGVYQGDGTTCFPNPCVVPTGACCFDDGTCEELTEADCLAQTGTYQGDGTGCEGADCPVILEPFVDALPLPGAATPTSGTIGGVATYDIEIVQVQQQLHRDLSPTTVWGYDGLFPGPTIEATVDQPVTVNWINDLRDSTNALLSEHYLPVDLCLHGPDHEGSTPRTVTHLHGAHVEQQYDGYPEDTVLPGGQHTYVYGNHQLPATLWYHDHALGITRLNVMMGLAGFYLLRDSVETSLGLPDGEYEIPMVIQDRSFNPDGSFSYPEDWVDMFFGDKILVNGKVWPYHEVEQGKYRLRLLNGSNSRTYELRLSTGDPFTVIGTDGGLLSAPVVRDTIRFNPGERYDVVVDFGGHSPGTEIFLLNSAPAPYPGAPGVGVIEDVMKFIVLGVPGFTGDIPDTLRPVEEIEENTASLSREFVLQKGDDPCTGFRWLINGLLWDDITEYPVLGDTEIWTFINKSGMVHPMHMHLVMFQILDRQPFVSVGDTIMTTGPRVPPDSSEAGWKDTAPVHPDEILRVIARFEDYTGKYAYHCHILEHEDHEMMRQFEVVNPVAVTPDGIIRLRLAAAQPNPFASSTRIAFEIPKATMVDVRIYDVSGREVRSLQNGILRPGEHSVTWDGRDAAGRAVRTGIYIVRLQASGEALTQKMTVVH